MKGSAKPFSTTTRVHPSYLPYLQSSSQGAVAKGARAVKWLSPALVIAYGASYGLSAYREHSLASAAETQADMRRRQLMLDDAYGDRSSLEGLEHAMRVYEAQAQAQAQSASQR